ncbi:MAG: hypothetical protein R2716_03340 [Microthrixaceae bacterium]
MVAAVDQGHVDRCVRQPLATSRPPNPAPTTTTWWRLREVAPPGSLGSGPMCRSYCGSARGSPSARWRAIIAAALRGERGSVARNQEGSVRLDLEHHRAACLVVEQVDGMQAPWRRPAVLEHRRRQVHLVGAWLHCLRALSCEEPPLDVSDPG